MTALPLDGLAALVALATVGSFTPGPNTMLALATGVRFGWRRVGPHALGVAVGLAAMLGLAAAGAAAVLLAVPAAGAALRAAGVAWLLWLAWRIGRGGGTDRQGLDRPLAAWQSALLQFVNVKGWMLVVAVTGTWLGAGGSQATGLRAAAAMLTFAATTAAANYAWAAVGSSLQAWLAVGRRRAWFDRGMGVALAASALAMLR